MKTFHQIDESVAAELRKLRTLVDEFWVTHKDKLLVRSVEVRLPPGVRLSLEDRVRLFRAVVTMMKADRVAGVYWIPHLGHLLRVALLGRTGDTSLLADINDGVDPADMN